MEQVLALRPFVPAKDYALSKHDPGRLVADYGVKPPKPPAMQPWGLKVGFIFDPSGVLWHVAEAPF